MNEQLTVQDHITAATQHALMATQMLSGAMQQSAAVAQVMDQITSLLGQGQQAQPLTLESAAGGLQSDMQAAATR